jgi:hypothetical protein
MPTKQRIDFILNKLISRKLLVFIICTLLLIFEKVNSDNWITIAGIYIGGQAIIDAVTKYKDNAANKEF